MMVAPNSLGRILPRNVADRVFMSAIRGFTDLYQHVVEPGGCYGDSPPAADVFLNAPDSANGSSGQVEHVFLYRAVAEIICRFVAEVQLHVERIDAVVLSGDPGEFRCEGLAWDGGGGCLGQGLAVDADGVGVAARQGGESYRDVIALAGRDAYKPDVVFFCRAPFNGRH